MKRTIIVGLISLAVVAAACSPAPVSTGPESVAPASVGPTSSAEPTLAGCAPACLPPNLTQPGELPAGEYETVYFFGSLMAVNLDQPMTSNEDSTGEFHLTTDIETWDLLFWEDVYPLDPIEGTRITSVGSRAADLVEWLSANPNFVVSDVRDGAIGDLPATVLDLSLSDAVPPPVDPDCPSVCAYVVGYPQWEGGYAIATPMLTRWYLADVRYGAEAHLFVAVVQAVDVDTFASVLPVVEALMDSVRVPATPA